MARFNESYNSFNCASAISMKPSKIRTSFGSSNCVTSVSGLSMPVSLESTGLIQWAFTASNSSSVISPSITYVVAVRITGSSSSRMHCTHCTAESALWSNCPGKYSTENARSFSFIGNISLYKVSTGGSANTPLHARSNVSSDRFSIS